MEIIFTPEDIENLLCKKASAMGGGRQFWLGQYSRVYGSVTLTDNPPPEEVKPAPVGEENIPASSSGPMSDALREPD